MANMLVGGAEKCLTWVHEHRCSKNALTDRQIGQVRMGVGTGRKHSQPQMVLAEFDLEEGLGKQANQKEIHQSGR